LRLRATTKFLALFFRVAREAGGFAWPEGAFSCPAERQGPTGPRKVRRTRRGKASSREATRLPWVATRRPAARRLSWSRASARLARRRRASRAALSPRTKKYFPSLPSTFPPKRTNPLKTLDETRFSPSLARPEKNSHTPLRVRERFGNIRGGRRNRRGVYPGIRNV
jgi:hypothetical protein